MVAKSQTPTHTNTVTLKMHLLLFSDSWVDFTVHKFTHSSDLKINHGYLSERFISSTWHRAEKIASLKTHCVLLQSDLDLPETLETAKVVSLLSLHLSSDLPKYHLHTITYKSKIPFLELKVYISLPGNMTKMYLQKSHTFNLTALWIDKNYQKYSDFETNPYRSCHLGRILKRIVSRCLKISSLLKAHFIYFYLRTEQKMSWKYACNLCGQMGANLIEFTEKEQVQELLAMFKFYDELSFEGTYIGLTIEQVIIITQLS